MFNENGNLGLTGTLAGHGFLKGHIWLRRSAITLVIFAIILVFAGSWGLVDRTDELRDWVQGLGLAGYGIFIVIFIGIRIFPVPSIGFSAMGAILFGTIWGTLIVSFASTVTAGISFIVARYFAAEGVRKRLDGVGRLSRLFKLTESHGNLAVIVTRLLPVFPFVLLNYGFGLTRIAFLPYLFWSWLCMLPTTILFVSGTDTVLAVIRQHQIPWEQVLLIIACIISIAAAVIAVQRKMKGRIGSIL